MGFFNEFLSKNRNNLKNDKKEETEKSELERIKENQIKENQSEESETKENKSEENQTIENQSEEKQPKGNDFIECYDEQGKKVLIPREEMIKTVLPNQFKNHWNTADALYNDILLALKDEFNKEALDAAKHLVHIDEIKERGYTTLAIAFMANELHGEAEKTLNEYINLFGKSALILTNLARVHYSRDDKEGALELVWESMCLDPNQEYTLQWWMLLDKEIGGKYNYIDLLKRATAIKGSWLPQLYLARYYLEQKDLESAKPLYEYVLNSALDELPVLFIISGDLGNNGYINEIIDIIAPLYDPEKHDIMAGINILHAYLQTGNHVEGQKLINKLMKIERADVRAFLSKLSNDFELMKKGQPKKDNVSEKIEYEIVITDKPVWYYGLKSPEWLLPNELEKGNIGFLTFVDLTNKTEKVTELQPEDDSGRMTRSLPLLLQEIMFFNYNKETRFLLPIAKDIGPAVIKAEYDIKSLSDAARTNDLDLLVTGSITENGNEYEIKVILFESKNKSIQAFDMKLLKEGNNTEFINSLNNIISKIAEISDIQPVEADYYNVPNEDIVYNYLGALGQSLMQSLVDNKVVKFENLWGERNILNWYLNLALSAPENVVLKIILISGLAKSKSYGSEVYKEFQEQVVALISDEQSENSQIKRLVPFVYYLFDMKKEFIAIMDKNSKLN
ncbi:hypothetical protein EHE19_006810 [Ruminiclostridium herbifermentans]|uniref:Uncharacterized protein n=1 Tax=Ruminiclostridium herbifermentans TaxID=2488810 RepID=A0A4U7JAX8_9FIRM|nr:hypothetical protein [Ruminiclostridium herbifermentans]QNU68134.1 hypothetical protein EHE19_006810 [Ruminiclostridium herbifermentans]